jgi:hypothetical protein
MGYRSALAPATFSGLACLAELIRRPQQQHEDVPLAVEVAAGGGPVGHAAILFSSVSHGGVTVSA